MDAVYSASNTIVVRQVEDLLIIIPLTSDIDDTDNKPYILNATGQIIWRQLNGRKNLKKIVADLAAEFKMPARVIKKDVTGFVLELLKRKMLVKNAET
jgi:hypothetical protein